MRSLGTLRFYALTAAIFLVVVGLGLRYRTSFPEPAQVIEGFKNLSPTHGHGQVTPPEHVSPEKPALVEPPAHSTTAQVPQSAASPVHNAQSAPSHAVQTQHNKPFPAQESQHVAVSDTVWDPALYDDVPLPELDQWPGPGPDGKYGDWTDMITEEQHKASNENQRMKHLNITSKMTTHGKFIKIDWLGDHEGYNPNLVPHPYKNGTWIVIAQRDKSKDDNTFHSQELYCEATFVNNTIKCTKSPLLLPIAATTSAYCDDIMEWFNSMVGPHDARLFHGRDRPYVMYNQQSNFNCIGQWIQDARRLLDYGGDINSDRNDTYFFPVNLQKAGGDYGWIEKNWYPFWDSKGEVYMHYDLTPRRLFAKLNPDGSVGPDLSEASHKHDSECMARLMPKLKDTGLEWVHQASNGLEITLCKRANPDCKPNDDNTFIFSIFQTKTFYMHGQYEPYFVLFRRTAPFEIYGISKTPFWYHGRGTAFGSWRVDINKPKDQSQMIFTTSISWQQQNLTYSGFLDDELMICFGIEDKHSGVIDVTVGDLIADVATC